MPTFTEEEFKDLLQQVAAEAAKQATEALGVSGKEAEIERAIGSRPRISERNWIKDRNKWLALSKEERQAELVNRDLAAQFMGDVMPIRNAKNYVASARRTGVAIPPELLELSQRDEEDLNTAEIEGLTEKPIHTGDGRLLIKGKRIMCHPALAQALENKGAARKIDDERDEIPDGGVVTPIASVARP